MASGSSVGSAIFQSAKQGGELALRAVVFDYGMVLSGAPDPEAHAALMRITGLKEAEFESLYWRDRADYDEGKLTGLEFWHKLNLDAGLELSPAALDELNRLDGRMWTTENDAMIAWAGRLKERGLRTAILSNMGDNVLASIRQSYMWPEQFDVRVWSFEHHMVKPDEAIYRLTLGQLGTQAARLGMAAIRFSTVERLREDLIARGMERELPMP